MEFECDTLILSVGLIPYVSLLNYIDCPISSTKGAVVNQYMETMIPGIFTVGNCLHVHDVVDFVSQEARLAGRSAALYLKNEIDNNENKINIKPGNITFKFRVRKPLKDQIGMIRSGDVVLGKVVKPALIPSEMVMVNLSKDKLQEVKDEIVISVEDR